MSLECNKLHLKSMQLECYELLWHVIDPGSEYLTEKSKFSVNADYIYYPESLNN